MDPALHTAARLVVASLLLLAALHKLRDRDEFRRILAAYRILPGGLVHISAYALPRIELVLAGMLLWPRTASIAAAPALLLIGAYSAAIAVNLARGRRDIDCGCGFSGDRLSATLLVRNAVLMAVAAVVPLVPTSRPLIWVDVLTIVGTTVCATLLFHGASLAGDRSLSTVTSRRAS